MFRLAMQAALLAAVVVAGANVFSLMQRASSARVRDLRVMRLLVRAGDLAGLPLLSGAPHWMHRELDLTTPLAAIALDAAAAGVALVALALLASLLAAVLPASPRGRALLPALVSVAALPLVFATGASSKWLALAAIVMGVSIYRIGLWRAAPASPPLDRRRRLSPHWIAAGLIAATIALAPLAFTSHGATAPRPERDAPNIILISIDSLRADHLGAYGYGRNTTPNLDRLATQGALFETVMSPTSWTLPSHMTLMTSLPPERHGVISDRFRLPRGVETLPQRLQRAGYRTAGIVSATYLDGAFGFSRGFDDYDDYSLVHSAGEASRKDVTSPELTRRSIDWLRRNGRRADGRPFFLFLHMYDVHYDYNPPDPFAQMFDPAYGGGASGEIGSVRVSTPRRDVQHVVALYDGEIAFVDAHVGNIMAALKALGLEENTIVAVTADHGEEFLDHGQTGHFKTLYDEVLHVPLLIRYPGHVPAGRRVAGQVRLMDVAPTLLALAGVRSPKPATTYEARSLEKRLTGPPTCALPAFGDLRGQLVSMRTDDAKLIWDLTTNRQQFYDLRSDPRERRAFQSAEGQAMHLELARWRASAVHGSSEVINLAEEEKSGLRSLGYLH
jgi:arylsulfatase A-like enzyme